MWQWCKHTNALTHTIGSFLFVGITMPQQQIATEQVPQQPIAADQGELTVSKHILEAATTSPRLARQWFSAASIFFATIQRPELESKLEANRSRGLRGMDIQ